MSWFTEILENPNYSQPKDYVSEPGSHPPTNPWTQLNYSDYVSLPEYKTPAPVQNSTSPQNVSSTPPQAHENKPDGFFYRQPGEGWKMEALKYGMLALVSMSLIMLVKRR